METTNRSGLQCQEHPRQEITNIGIDFDSIRPLCPDCVETYHRNNSKLEIESWKHCINRAALSTKNTLDELRSIYEAQKQWKSIKPAETIESENIKRLHSLKDKYHKLVEEVFSRHEQQVRQQIRSQYRVDQPDTSKLRMAIEEMERVLVKLGHINTVLPALKKCLLLDHRSLVDYFGHLRQAQPKANAQSFFFENPTAVNQLKGALERSVAIDEQQKEPQEKQADRPEKMNSGPPVPRRFSNHMSVGQHNDPFQPLSISMPDYFTPDCFNKLLHFFVPCSFELKFLPVEEAERASWRSVQFKAKAELPCYFKSLIAPTGEIYLTGGSEEERRCREIYRYSFEKNYLEQVGSMLTERSSHSVCYQDRKIFIIGGFSGAEGLVTRDCEVFDTQTGKCSKIAPLNTPSANSCATPFGKQYLFKFGGILNETEGNSLIEMYSLKSNRWIAVAIETPPNSPALELLSFSAAAQINEREILVFGGYDNSDLEKPERTCYALSVSVEKSLVQVRNYNHTPLPYAEGFWNNNPILHKGRLVALQNVTDQQDELTALADERRVVIFNGDNWQ